MAMLKIEHLNFYYPDSKKPLLKDIKLTIQEGSFVTICGKSGCGKTTLLRHLKPSLTPSGNKSGRVYFKGTPIENLDERTQAMKLGYVLQNPNQQIVTDKVWHELAFGLENLGYDGQTIRLRVAEMASFFGIGKWFHQEVGKLSGGQKQLLNLAAIMVMQPEVLILDEPTAQLDPIAARNFIEMLRRIHEELGVTIILSEHRLEDVLPLSNHLIVMEEGKVLVEGTVPKVGKYLFKTQHELFRAMPTAMQVAMQLDDYGTSREEVVTIREGRSHLKNWLERRTQEVLYIREPTSVEAVKCTRRKPDYVIELKDIYFKYEKTSEDILKGLSYNIERGKFYAIVGGNGTGKSTTLTLLAGIAKPYRGKIKWHNSADKVILLPQNPQILFEYMTVREELMEGSQEEEALKMAQKLRLEDVLERHPYDLSGGQMQCLALAKALLRHPTVLLLDEPTKGLDASFKMELGKHLKILQSQGMTIVMVSHDLDFCGQYANSCALCFDGQMISSGAPKDFFTDNNFYTTKANHISRGLLPNCITLEEVITACQRYGAEEQGATM